MGKKSQLSVAERREVVLMMVRKEEPIMTLSRRYGVSETTLHRWREDFLVGGQSALAGGDGKKVDSRTAEIERLKTDLARRDQVIGELTIANRILKKSADGLL